MTERELLMRVEGGARAAYDVVSPSWACAADLLTVARDVEGAVEALRTHPHPVLRDRGGARECLTALKAGGQLLFALAYLTGAQEAGGSCLPESAVYAVKHSLTLALRVALEQLAVWRLELPAEREAS